MIGIAINYLLKSSTALIALVGSKIYPMAIEEKDPLPAVIYRISSSIPTYVQNEAIEEVSTVEVLSFAMSYLNALNISKEVRTALEFKTGIVQGISIKQIRIEKIEEDFDFDSNVFYSKITFTIKTN